MIVTPEIFAKLSQQGFAETDLGRQPLLGKLTEDELAIFEIERSLDWCGVGWEERDKARVERILESRTPTKKPLLKKVLPFL